MIRVGIAGYGMVGKVRHRFIDEHPQMRVVAVCDQTIPETQAAPAGTKPSTFPPRAARRFWPCRMDASPSYF